MDTQQEYIEVKLSVVLDYWLSEYKPVDPEYRVMETGWMVDPFPPLANFLDGWIAHNPNVGT